MNTFAVLRLLPMSDRDKDAEILALCHQIAVLECRLGNSRHGWPRGDRAFAAYCNGCRSVTCGRELMRQ